MKNICPNKLVSFVEGAPSGVVGLSLPVLLTGPGIDRISCECGDGIDLRDADSIEKVAELAGQCSLSAVSVSENEPVT